MIQNGERSAKLGLRAALLSPNQGCSTGEGAGFHPRQGELGSVMMALGFYP